MDTNVQITEKDLSEVLINSTMLVAFHQTTWTGEISSSDATDDVKAARGAKGKVGTFRMKLLANNEEAHAKVKSAIGAAYREHMKLTLPWGNSQYRLLPNASFMDYAQKMQAHKGLINTALDEFVAAYPAARDKAIADLGGLGDASHYPTSDQVRGKFGIDVDFEPVPGGKGFPGLPPQFAQALQQRLDHQVKARMKEAIDEMWGQVKDLVMRYANQCRPDGKIYESTTEGLRQLPGRIRTFNVIGDPALDGVANMIAGKLAMYDVKDLQQDATRAWCYSEALKILSLLP